MTKRFLPSQYLAIRAAVALVPLIFWANGRSADAPRINYPPAPRLDHVDRYHGVKVPDPYRWLEESDSRQTRDWIEAENRIAFAFLESIPQRKTIRERMTALWNYERYGVPFKEGGRYFFSRNDGLQNQNVLYTTDSLEADPRVLLDPNSLSKDGTIAMASTSVTDDGRYLAYGLAEAGSDWNRIKVRDVATGNDLADEVRWVKFSGASWTKDGRGFYYSRFDAPKPGSELKDVTHFHKVYFHKLGTPQGEDLLVYERKDQPDWYMHGSVTEDGRYLVIGVTEKLVKNGLFYQDLSRSQWPVVALLDKFDSQYRFVGNDGPVFWVATDLDARAGGS